MAYERLNLADGDVLKAEHLAHMEDALAQETSLADLLVSDAYWYENVSVETELYYENIFGGNLPEVLYEFPDTGVYTVTINGVVYEGQPLRFLVEMSGNKCPYIGNIALFQQSNYEESVDELIAEGVISEEQVTGENFCLLFDGDWGGVYTTDTTSPAIISLYGSVLQRIEDKYLSKEVLANIPFIVKFYSKNGSDWEFTSGSYRDISQASASGRPVFGEFRVNGGITIAPFTVSNPSYGYGFHAPVSYVDTSSADTGGAHTWWVDYDNSIRME